MNFYFYTDSVYMCLSLDYQVANRGEVLQVKVLGVLTLIDEDETDWKVLAININDPLADKLNGTTLILYFNPVHQLMIVYIPHYQISTILINICRVL